MFARPAEARRSARVILTGILLTGTLVAHAQVSVETRDGLGLAFDAGGSVRAIRVGERALPLLKEPSGFFVTDVARSARDLMPGGDFQAGDSVKDHGWQLGGSWKITAEGGTRFVRAASKTAQGSGKLWSPLVPVQPGKGYLVAARVRTASNADRFSPGLYVVQYDAEGKLVKVPTPGGEAVQIGIGVPRSAARFRQVSKTFVAQPRTATVQVYANVYRSIGRFDLDDVRLGPLEAPPTRLEGRMEPQAEGIVFKGRADDLGLEVQATFTPRADHVQVDGIVRDTAGRDRALRVAFHLPLDARGWTWWDDIVESRNIAAQQRYAYYGPDWSVGRGRQVSVFPFASVTGDRAGLSLAQRVDQPRFFRIFYDPATGYCVDYNLGLSADTTKFPSSASFHFLMYRHDPAWGMRAAARCYYDMFPDLFKVRAERQGLYCHNVPTDLADPEDFGFCFDLSGFSRPERKKLQDHGIYLLVHPMGTEAHIRWPKGYDWGTKNGRPTLEQIEDIFLNPRPEYNKGRAWRGLTQRHAGATFEESRRRVLNSAVHGPDGRFRLHAYSETIQFIATSADPDIPLPNMAEGERKYYIGRHVAIAKKAGSEIDGVDFDNIAITAGRTRENFRREHFRYVDHPLVYDLRTRGVCIQTGINFYEFVKDISDEMHAQGKLCTGNMGSDPHTQTFFGHLLDKHGGEIQYHAPTRRLRGYRMMAFQKPVSHIVYAGAVAAGQEEIVMHRWLAFGEFPAMHELGYSGRGSDFDRGRPLYKRFMPIMQRIAYAGWEPITHARVSGEGLFVERFGNWRDGDLHFTVHNDSDEPSAGVLTVDKAALGITGKPACVELLSGEVVSADDRTRAELPPHHTKVFNLFPRDRGGLGWWRGPYRLVVKGGGRVLKGEAVLISAAVEGGVRGVQAEVAAPAGWKAQPVPGRERSWRLRPARGARKGAARVTARVTAQDGTPIVLTRTVPLIPVPALELAADRLALTLDVPCPLDVPVRNNTGRPASATVKVDLPKQLGTRALQTRLKVPAASTAAARLKFEPLHARPGVYRTQVTVGETRYTVQLHARKGLLARRLTKPPQLDGILHEWTDPPSAHAFNLLGRPGKPTQQTQVWIGYDEAALYVAFRCAEDKMAELKATISERDGGVWSDDDVAIFLDPGASRGTYCHLEINPLGTIYDSFISDSTWNSGATARARRQADAWTLEVAMPWSGRLKKPRSGDRWGINLGRQEKPHAETSAVTSTFKKTAAFADLIFE